MEILSEHYQVHAMCRDLESGLDHVVTLNGGGTGCCEMEIWSVDPDSFVPTVLYSASWGSNTSDEGAWNIRHLVAQDGTCLWRNRKEKIAKESELWLAAREALSVGEDTPFGTTVKLPTREIPSATAEEWLQTLEGIMILEGALYRDPADWDSWRVVQVTRPYFDRYGEGIAGVVLVLDRRTGRWRAVYDVPGRSAKRWDFRMLGLVVHGDRLLAQMCYSDCGHWGDYRSFEIDLHSHRRVLLESSDVGDDENRVIEDLDAEIFSDGPYPFQAAAPVRDEPE